MESASSIRRRLRPALSAAPWLAIALLAHGALMLYLSMTAPPRPGAFEPSRIAVVEGKNPFAQEEEPPPEPAREPATPEPPRDVPLLEELLGPLPPAPEGPSSLQEVLGPPEPGPVEPAAAEAIVAPAGGGGEPVAALSSLSPVSARTGPARDAARQRYGGDEQTDSAVQAALGWLARHQDADGHWGRTSFHRHCPPGDPCGGIPNARLDQDGDVGVTALAMLCFLAEGSSHRGGPYVHVVAPAVRYLLGRQRPDGAFAGPDALRMYNHCLATIALAEAALLGGDGELLRRVQLAADFIAAAQTRQGGWDYRGEPTSPRNDTSIVGWAIMAMHSAAAAGARVPPEVAYNALRHLHRATRFDGAVWYADHGAGFEHSPEGLPRYRYGEGMLAVGLTGYTLLGYRPDSLTVATQRRGLLAEPPSAARMLADETDMHSTYYWYYGTLGLFLGAASPGEPPRDWAAWHESLRRALLGGQDGSLVNDGQPRHRHGSWPPYGPRWGKWGRSGGRVYSTALACLTLQTSYRFVPAGLTAPGLDYTPALLGAYRDGAPAARAAVLDVAEQLRNELAEPVLLAALHDDRPELRLRAALALARFGAGSARAELQAQRNAHHGPMAEELERALDTLDRDAGGAYGPILRHRRPENLVLFRYDQRRPWIGQVCNVRRDGQTLGRLTVLAVFDHARAAVGRPAGSAPTDLAGATVTD